MADGGEVKEEVKPKPDVAEEGKVERQPAVAEGKEVGRQPAIAEVKQVTPQPAIAEGKQVTPQPAVAEDKKVKRQPAVAKPSATQPRSLTRVWDWIICGFIISALVHRVYVHVYVPAMTMVQVPKQVTCPIHQSDPMQGGLLPTRFQTGFGKAAWHIPRHWKTWMSTPIFQKQGWLNVPLAESRQMDKIQRELKTQLPKLIGEEDNAPLLAALQKLSEETTSMAACIGGDVDTMNREQRVSRVSSMSLDCKLRIFWQWSTMQNLALVLASTENIVAANIQKLDNIRSLRASVAEARDLIVRLQQDSAAKVANTDQQIIESTVTWLNTTDFAEQNPIYRTYRVAQRQYMHLTWLDLVYASLDGLLHAKEQQITYIAHVLQNYDLVETLASVKHGISTSPFHNARHGVLDSLPYRSTLLLSELRSNTTLIVFPYGEDRDPCGAQMPYRIPYDTYTPSYPSIQGMANSCAPSTLNQSQNFRDSLRAAKGNFTNVYGEDRDPYGAQMPYRIPYDTYTPSYPSIQGMANSCAPSTLNQSQNFRYSLSAAKGNFTKVYGEDRDPYGAQMPYRIPYDTYTPNYPSIHGMANSCAPSTKNQGQNFRSESYAVKGKATSLRSAARIATRTALKCITAFYTTPSRETTRVFQVLPAASHQARTTKTPRVHVESNFTPVDGGDRDPCRQQLRTKHVQPRPELHVLRRRSFTWPCGGAASAVLPDQINASVGYPGPNQLHSFECAKAREYRNAQYQAGLEMCRLTSRMTMVRDASREESRAGKDLNIYQDSRLGCERLGFWQACLAGSASAADGEDAVVFRYER
ncbi:uncharacterized protein MYCFIDRAFT_198817 [Pseudocercospora fijiensis CIRAD86]|uniref:Uncharacterized protein n=1 Tax=Pseudocercospora fijiensis (strain CIRAD86) TaxID=383855 RepID=M3AT34_PSEFD|nr:uncharacterized protein MYCFIDRAFT_198817 [Pseudocercospora fijiensis CIRAD86]EME80647.1 hypothetical protein MYCFIDRAFT_198817 [Pseudocercospora fijiensis CIRAD86]